MNFYEINKKIFNGKKLDDSDQEYVVKQVDYYWNNHPDTLSRFPRWEKILAWVAGYQYVDYNRVTRRLEYVPNKTKQRRIIVNRLKPIFRTMLGKLRATQPQLGVLPNTAEYEDIQAAKVGDLVLEALSTNVVDFNKIRKQFYCWLLLVNRACIRVFWDLTKRGIIGYERVTDDTGNTMKILITEEGDVGMEVVSPFNYRHDPLYTEPDRWRWFLYGELVDRQSIADAYGISKEELKPEKTLNKNFSGFVTFDNENLFEFRPFTPELDEDTVIKYEFWTPQSYIVIAGNKVLEYGVNEYEIIPFFTMEDNLIPLESYDKNLQFNDSIFKELITPQQEYNRQLSIISSAIERSAKIKVLASLNALMNKKQLFDDGSLVVVDYMSQFGEPKQLRLDPLPPLTIPFKQELERDLENVSGVHEVSFGRLPERASHASGVLVNLLLEQDDSVLDPIIIEADRVFSKAWSFALKLVQEHYSVPRLLKLTGRDKRESIIQFKGSDLMGNTDVSVTTNLSLPKSRVLRSEWILRLAQLGLIQDPKLILEMLEFGEAKKLYDVELAHQKKAFRENQKINENASITPQEWQSFIYELDDHKIHLDCHLRDRLSEIYENYTESQKAALDGHIQQHLTYIQQQQMQQMAALTAAEQQKEAEKTPEETQQVGSAAGVETAPLFNLQENPLIGMAVPETQPVQGGEETIEEY